MSPNNPITELSSPLFLKHSFVSLQWFVVEIWPLFEVCLTWMESIVEKLPHLKERERDREGGKMRLGQQKSYLRREGWKCICGKACLGFWNGKRIPISPGCKWSYGCLSTEGAEWKTEREKEGWAKLKMRRDAGIGEKLRCQTFMSFLAGQGRNEKRARKEMRERGLCVWERKRENLWASKCVCEKDEGLEEFSLCGLLGDN